MRYLFLPLAAIAALSVHANTAIETETAQLGKQGEGNFSQSYEYVHGRDGTSGGTLTQFEYAITDRSEILIEPFFYVWDHPKGERRVSGRGDLEITPSYMAVLEDGWVPAVVLATKVKVPTGERSVGGTKKYDFFPYVILGQHYGDWTFNANLGVNFARREDTSGYDHRVVWDLEAEREFGGNWTTFWEAFRAEDGVKTVSTALQYKWIDHVNTFGVLSYNENHEVVYRMGFNVEF
jgi:hypothetical protein